MTKKSNSNQSKSNDIAKKTASPEPKPQNDKVGQLVKAEDHVTLQTFIPLPKGSALFTDSAGIPRIHLPNAVGRKTYPVDSPMVRALVSTGLFQQNEKPPRKSDEDSMIRVLTGHAIINGPRDPENRWDENLFDENPFILAVYILVQQETQDVEEWETTCSEMLIDLTKVCVQEKIDRGDDWPKKPRCLSLKLKEKKDDLAELGIHFRAHRTGGSRAYIFQFSPTSDAAPLLASHATSSRKCKGHMDLWKDDARKQDLIEDLKSIANESGEFIRPTGANIRDWNPNSWPELLGNEDVKSCLIQRARVLRTGEKPGNLLLLGRRGTGKEAGIRLLIRGSLCEQPDESDGSPCNKCQTCIMIPEDHTNCELAFGEQSKDSEDQIILARYRCRELTLGKLSSDLGKLKDFRGQPVITLEGLDELPGGKLSHGLLELIDTDEYLWIATGTRYDHIRDDFFTHFELKDTIEPEPDALVRFLAQRCRDWSIQVTPVELLLDLVHKSDGVVGEALEALARAADKGRKLTQNIIDNMTFRT